MQTGVQHFEEELEINDFPQTARWRVTSKEAIQTIQEVSGAAITCRGSFFPPDRKPLPGERKLYVLVEADEGEKLLTARREIVRIIRDELVRLQEQQGMRIGRFSVV